jgi:hypothetical protein
MPRRKRRNEISANVIIHKIARTAGIAAIAKRCSSAVVISGGGATLAHRAGESLDVCRDLGCVLDGQSFLPSGN